MLVKVRTRSSCGAVCELLGSDVEWLGGEVWWKGFVGMQDGVVCVG